MPGADKVVIGWREWVALPDFGVTAVKAKVDTGARSSSLHAFDTSEVVGSNGERIMRFFIHPFQKDDAHVVEAMAPLVEHREIRSSNGSIEVRPVVSCLVQLLGRPRRIELSLANRDEMGFRLLLGRVAIRRRYVVDPARSFIGGGTSVAPPGPPEDRR